MVSEGLQFWHENLGRFMSDAAPERSGKAAVPTWLGKSDPESVAKGKGLRVAPWPIGAKIPLYYIATPAHAWVFGKVAMESTDRVTFRVGLGEDKVDGRHEIVRWLMEEGDAPFLVGVVTEANPNDTFRISHHPTRGFFCESSGGFSFNLEETREDAALVSGKPWREVATAIYRYDEFRRAPHGSPERMLARDNLAKIFKRMPELQSVLPKIKARPGSGEMELLRLIMS